MKLWKLNKDICAFYETKVKSLGCNLSYIDEYVILTETEETARQIASEKGGSGWLNPALTICREIPFKEGVISQCLGQYR